jgi:hypothetical protein
MILMNTVRAYDLLHKRALVTRESARVFRRPLAEAIAGPGGDAAIDFSGVDALTPSFIDELLLVATEVRQTMPTESFRVMFLNTPKRLSEKLATVGKGRGLTVEESGPGAWLIAAQAADAAKTYA